MYRSIKIWNGDIKQNSVSAYARNGGTGRTKETPSCLSYFNVIFEKKL